ncbi:flavin oxidoreductase [Caulobacter sp. B11]|uniref:flavin reductase family protein n=1 Tax=Caulobacter sp. B11 TaxID=2048899 RepID=UPI000C12D0F6|nr:flavin reductase family protein [Caulobacter sp. B11]PHY14140.1 flavin oxidoreductase [Caulobacter sp. B11]
MSQAVTIELGGGGDHDVRALRNAFGCFTTGVTVVTTCAADGRRVGLTANSFTSVSLDPPLALVCVDLKSSSLPMLDAAGLFTVNVLHADHQALARQFTRKEGDRFEGVETETWSTGAPVLPGCMANFECVTHQVFDAGDHRVYVGRVVKLRYDPDHEPLVYLQGRFRRVHVED